MSTSDDFDIEMKTTFLDEATQLLEDSEAAFIALEGGDHSAELIDKIFRLAHNFKGSAGAVGFHDLSHLAHKVEDLLILIKSGEIRLKRDVIAVLFRAIDELKLFIAGLRGDFAYVHDSTQIVNELRVASVAGRAGGNAPSPIQATEPIVVAEPAIEKTVQHVKRESHEKGASAKANQEDVAIRVSAKKLDELINIVGELVVNQSIMDNHRLHGSTGSEQSIQTISYMEKIVKDIQDRTMALRMVPLKPLFQKMNRIVRDVSAQQGKQVLFVTEGDHVEIDKTVMEQITDPLTHLIRNAVDHGIEPSEDRIAAGKPEEATITLKAEQKEDQVEISIKDDGRGMNREKLIAKGIEKGLIAATDQLTDEQAYALIFKPGFSTKEQVTDISGRGVGMDVVQRAVSDLKGKIDIATKLGKGSEFVVSLPLSLSIIQGLVVSVDDRKYVIPISQLTEIIEYQKLTAGKLATSTKIVDLRGEVLPVWSLSQILHRTRNQKPPSESAPGVVTTVLGHKVSYQVHEIVGQQQVVIKQLGREIDGMVGVLGGAILSNGEPSLILDLHDLTIERNLLNVSA